MLYVCHMRSQAEPLDDEALVKDDAARFEAEFRRDHPYQFWLTLVGPPAVTLLLLGVLAVVFGAGHVKHLAIRAVAAFFVFGKFAILEPTTALSPETLFALIVYMDLAVAVVISSHMAAVFRLPWVGKRLVALTRDGQFMLQAQPWMRRMTFVGLVVFVMFPLAATGSIGGAIFGRLLGLRRRTTFIGVSLGSVLGCGLMYFGAEFIRAHFGRDDPLVKLGGIGVVLAILWLLNARYRRAKARAGY